MINEIKELLETNKLSGFRGDTGLTEGGPKVRRLEDAFREYFNIKHAVAFNSATAALHSACIALDVNKAVVTPFTFTASVSCVELAGGKPLFQDINPATYCMDVTEYDHWYVDAIIPVHLFGGMADMDKIMELGIPVIEDAAQAIGSKWKGRHAGTIGQCGVFSFNQSKVVSCGEGGMLITDEDEIAYRAKLVRNHGEVVDATAGITGYNYRMTEIEAVIAYHRFKELDTEIARRKENVNYFRENIRDIEGVTPQWINPDVGYSWYVYSFEVNDNHKVARMMTERGIPLRGGYVTSPLNLAYGQYCPVCEDVWQNKIVVTDIISKDKVEMDKFINTLKEVMRIV
jgi:perosamine synthetase